MKKLVLLFFTFFMLGLTGYAQYSFTEGYIIKSNNDTVYGQVALRVVEAQNYKSCIFKKDDQQIKYLPDQILGFGYLEGNIVYKSTIRKGSFVKVLVEGAMSLYMYQGNFLVTKKGKVYQLDHGMRKVKVGDTEIMKENERWKGLLIYLISDHYSIPAGMVKYMKYSQKAISKLIVNYDKKTREEYKVFRRDKAFIFTADAWHLEAKYGVSFGITRSVIQNNLTISYSAYMEDQYRSFDPSFGLVFSLNFSRLVKGLYIQPGLSFRKSSYSSSNNIKNFYQEVDYNFRIGLTTLSVPVSVKYLFGKKKTFFYALGGITYEYNIKGDATRIVKYIYPYIEPVFKATQFDINKNYFVAFGGIGIEKRFKKLSVDLEMRYYQNKIISGNKESNAKLGLLAFSFIIFK
ncbi:MAG: outer membrane beta-barrel protein [Bacteroidales bacterium]|nr:outer membrane beta-barrel protein [Bacteroidales bacterium]